MPVEITIRDAQGYISGLPPWTDLAEGALDPLTAATSFKPAGYQYTAAYVKGRSDGRVRLHKHSKFPAGLLKRVTGVLDGEGIPYHLVVEKPEDDKRALPPYELVGVESRDYQDAAVEAALLNPRGVIQVPTGGGKTAIGARIVIGRGLHAIIVVPTKDLLHQYKRFLEEHIMDRDTTDDPTGGSGWGRCRIGQLGDGVVDPQPITVATVRTAAAAFNVAFESYEYGEYDDKDDTKVSPADLREWISGIGTLVADECHILGAQVTYDIATRLPAPNKYGMSASPWRDDNADLMIEGATGPVIYRIPVESLVDGGHLVPPIIQTIDTRGWWTAASWGQTCAKCGRTRPMNHDGPAKRCGECGGDRWRSEFTDAYRVEIVENAVRNGRIAEIVAGLEGATLVLVKQKKHGKLLKDLIPGSLFLSGANASKERNDAYDAVREGTLSTVVATTIADMGLDLPILRNLVLAGGGKSSTRHLQRLGRVARTYPGKDYARVIDLDDSHVHRWFRDHAKARRRIEKAEWGRAAIWI